MRFNALSRFFHASHLGRRRNDAMRLMNLALLCAATSLAAAGCDSESTGSLPTSASPTTSGIAVTLTGVIRVDETAQASAAATLSNGQMQPITTGWQSDAPAVATVTPAGLVAGVANGRATIFVISGGRQGQQVVRVVPNYDGQWAGLLRVTSCTQSGAFASVGFCDDFGVGTVDGFALGVTQTGELLTARAAYPPAIVFPATTAAIDGDGQASFTTTFSDTTSPVLSIAAAWRIGSATRGALTGTVTETWTVAGISGEGRLVQDITRGSRGGTSGTSRSGPRSRALVERLSRMR
jgi:hypothetical protein